MCMYYMYIIPSVEDRAGVVLVCVHACLHVWVCTLCACACVCVHMCIKSHYPIFCYLHCIHYITMMFYNLDCIIMQVCAHMNTMSGSVHVVYSKDSPLSKHYIRETGEAS